MATVWFGMTVAVPALILWVAGVLVPSSTPMPLRATATPTDTAAPRRLPPPTATEAETIVATIEDDDAASSRIVSPAPTALFSTKAFVRERTVFTAAAPAPLPAMPPTMGPTPTATEAATETASIVMREIAYRSPLCLRKM